MDLGANRVVILVSNAEQYRQVQGYAARHDNVDLRVLSDGEGIAALELKPEELVNPTPEMIDLFNKAGAYEAPTLLSVVEDDRQTAERLKLQ